MRLFLIRHGETPWTAERRYQGTTDIPLNAKGRQQAQAIARVLGTEDITRLYSSTLRRSRETAGIIARKLGLKPKVDSRIAEIDFGKWEGATFKEFSEENRLQFRRWCEGKVDRAPGGESIGSLSDRVKKFLKELLKDYSQETIGIVSHGGPIKMFLFEALKTGMRRPVLIPSIWAFQIEPASISLMEGEPCLLQICWTNRTHHLQSIP